MIINKIIFTKLKNSINIISFLPGDDISSVSLPTSTTDNPLVCKYLHIHITTIGRMSAMYLQKNFNYLKFREDVSFRKIAKETGINTNTLQILSKKNDENMRIEVVLKLADFFQVSLDEFVKKDLTTHF